METSELILRLHRISENKSYRMSNKDREAARMALGILMRLDQFSSHKVKPQQVPAVKGALQHETV